jgi:hypothetical protein
MWPIVYRPEIESDLAAALDWYDAKRAGLGNEFLSEYLSALDQVAQRPLSFAVAATGFRPCRLKRFPYVIHFRVMDQLILVVAVMSTFRDDAALSHRRR